MQLEKEICDRGVDVHNKFDGINLMILQYQSKSYYIIGQEVYYSIGRLYYIIGQLLHYRAFITLSVGTDPLCSSSRLVNVGRYPL